MTHFTPATIDTDFDQSGYSLIDLGDASPDKSRERWLFLWVIIQSLIDIGMIQPLGAGRRAIGAKDLERPDRRSAVNWLLYNKRDFFQVCDMAGANAHVIREQARKFLQMHVAVGQA